MFPRRRTGRGPRRFIPRPPRRRQQRSELFDRVYEGDAQTDSNSLEVSVRRLRKKIGAGRIETARGLGYRLVCDV